MNNFINYNNYKIIVNYNNLKNINDIKNDIIQTVKDILLSEINLSKNERLKNFNEIYNNFIEAIKSSNFKKLEDLLDIIYDIVIEPLNDLDYEEEENLGITDYSICKVIYELYYFIYTKFCRPKPTYKYYLNNIKIIK